MTKRTLPGRRRPPSRLFSGRSSKIGMPTDEKIGYVTRIMANASITIDRVPPGRQFEALNLVFADVEAAARARLVADLIATSGLAGLDGLLEAHRGDQRIGAVWAQMQAGAVGSLWPPVLAAPEGDPHVAAGLLRAACGYLKQAGAEIAQAVLAPDDRLQATRLTTARFVWMADLLYLASTERQFPRVAPAHSLQFEPYRAEAHQRMRRVIERTYAGTLDCPKLSGLRDIDDVLEGYRATGQFRADWWLIMRDGMGDIGCLLLTDHPQPGQVELIYMGIVPEARGKGRGILMTRHAQWLTRLAGRSRLVLAVDASNRPARTMYEGAGFVAWAERSVFMRSLTNTALPV